jgi:glutamine amidotransferase
MCRLLGIVASQLTEFGVLLTKAPRCLATLSREHRDGWGIAIHDAATWALHKGTAPAVDDARFHELATTNRGHVLVAHVRQKTVGPTCIQNTHPFERDGWVFAHNGTIQHDEALRAGCSGRRLREITGGTDSELFFAYVLTRLDEHGLTSLDDERSRSAATELIDQITIELRAMRIGAFNFLLTDGHTTFAHRFGRSLFVLERGPTDLGSGATLDEAPGARRGKKDKWTQRRQVVFVASERITDEAWREVPDGTLLRIDRTPSPRIVMNEARGSSRSRSAHKAPRVA